MVGVYREPRWLLYNGMKIGGGEVVQNRRLTGWSYRKSVVIHVTSVTCKKMAATRTEDRQSSLPTTQNSAAQLRDTAGTGAPDDQASEESGVCHAGAGSH